MGISGQYNDPLSEQAAIQLIQECFNKGITFLDTADVYGGDHANEKLVGKVPSFLDLLFCLVSVKYMYVTLSRKLMELFDYDKFYLVV